VRVVVCLLVVTACGRVAFEGVGTGADALSPCTGPFGAPAPIPTVNSAEQDWGGALTDDRLELYFGSDRAGGLGGTDLYLATRATRDAMFSPPRHLAELSTPGPDDNPFIEPDGLTLWFDSNGQLFTATRTSRTAPWGTPMQVSAVNTADDEVAPALSPDGLSLYFSSDRPGGAGDLDVWHARRTSKAAPFSPPTRIAIGNSSVFDCCAFVSADGTELMFTTNALSGGPGGIAVVSRDPATGAVSGAPAIRRLGPGAGNELDVFGTTDGEVIGFSSDFTDGSHDLWLMERACP
jgi:hypothetical protein